MRTYGRVPGLSGLPTVWVEVVTDPNGLNDQVYLTTLLQVLKLNLGESPFYANFGIPAQQSVIQQIFPDYYAALIQQQFAVYFASLMIARTSANPPTYQVSLITHNGIKINYPYDSQIYVPQ
ncbi:MAG TPA: hypothetical protein VND01_00365 [Candidatus Acidoferrales bacterium]|nr:hypothetical protein [Candidatus Acidoferrales bacterium]